MEAQAAAGPGIFSTIIQIFVSIGMFIVFVIAAALFALLAKYLISKWLFLKDVDDASRHHKNTVLLVKTQASNEQKEGAMEDFLRSLHRTLPKNVSFSLEVVSQNQFLKFYIVIPKAYKTIAESQLYAQYPEAEIEEVEDFMPKLELNSAVMEMKFRRSSILPLNTYRSMDEDLLKSISSILSKTEGDEQVIIQLALKRAGSKFWQRGLKALFYQLSSKKYNADESPTPAFAKFSQDLYTGKLRVAYIAGDALTANTKLRSVVGLFKSLKGPSNKLKISKFRLINNLKPATAYRVFESGDFWTPAELATIYHFPYKGNVVSNVVSTTSKRAPAPDILPKEGLVDPNDVSFIGTTNYRNENKVFGIKRFDRRRHLYIIGKTGGGKSKLLELLLISDIQSGAGCCLLDPHGDLAKELLKHVPKERIKDVVYVDPSDRDFPIGFNPLEPVEDYEVRQQLCTFLIAIFKKLFADTWNQRMEHLVRYITLALLETPDSNIMGIPRMLSDTTFRQRVISQITDPVVKSFWTTEFSASAEQYNREAIVPLLNKVGQFVANPIVRNMIGQKKNALDLEKFMNSGKIVLINISKGKLGDENAALLGSMFITKIQQAALSRAKIPEEERKDFYFYIDEFQNFATEAFSTILSEARKYRLDLTIAHQYMAQLPAEVKATAFGNVGSMITFAVGGDDAAYLAKEFAPVFTAEDIVHLNAREMYIKMSIDGKITEPFSARTIDVPKAPYSFEDEIISHSRLTYGKSRVSVENEIKRWSEATENVADEGNKFPEPII